MGQVYIDCAALYAWVYIIVWTNVQDSITGSFTAGIVLPALLYLHYVDRKCLIECLGLKLNTWSAGIGWGLAFGVVFAAASLAKALLLGQGNFWLTWPVEYWLSSVVAASVVEEVFFRGFLLHKLTGVLSFWTANVLVSSMFAAIHIPVWLSDGLGGGEMASHAAYVGTLSLIFGYIYYRVQSLWAPIILHAVNNYLTLITIAITYPLS